MGLWTIINSRRWTSINGDEAKRLRPRAGVHAAALAVAAEVLHPPRLWPEYHPGYCGVFLRDVDGNNVEAVHHSFTSG